MNFNAINSDRPDAHHVYAGSRLTQVEYDGSSLTEEQKFRESRRSWRKEEEKRAEEEEASREGGARKKHCYYVKPYAGITTHDFDHPLEECSECEVELVGTDYVYPLAQKSKKKSNDVLVYPYCLGCERLFNFTDGDINKKIDLIVWLLFGRHSDINEEDDHTSNINFSKQAKTMRRRAISKVRTTLYDHPSWDQYKTKVEIEKELHREDPTKSFEIIKKDTIKYINEDPLISIVQPIPNNAVFTASAAQLRNLVITTGGRDAIIGHKCSIVHNSPYAIDFDHIYPISKKRFNPQAGSIDNVQILSVQINRVKADLCNKEVVRWWTQLKKTYQKRYL